jgi:hypothetical protein
MMMAPAQGFDARPMPETACAILPKRTQRGKIEHAEWDECEASDQAMMLPISGKPEIGAVRRCVSVRGLRLR